MGRVLLALPIALFGLLRTTVQWAVYLYRRFFVLFIQRSIKLLGRVLPWGLSVGMGGWLAYAILYSSTSQVVSAVLGLLFSVFLILRPELSVLIILLLSATIVSVSAVPRPFTVGGQGFGATELLIVLTLPVLFFRAHANRAFNYPKSPLIMPMAFLIGSVVLSIAVTYELYMSSPRGPFPFAEVYNSVRPMFYYLSFFVILYSLDTKKKLRMVLRTAMWMACIVAVMMVIQYFLGTKRWIFIGRPESLFVASQSQDVDIARPNPPGLALVTILFVVAMTTSALRTSRYPRLVGLLATLVLGIALVFTYTRGVWITTFVSITVVWLAVNRANKLRLTMIAVISVVAMVLLGFAIGGLAPGEAGREFAKSTQERFLSIFEKETIHSNSLQNRFTENGYAIQQIRKSPIFGIGAGSPVGYSFQPIPGGQTVILSKTAIHNSYLELYMVYGLFGVISFVWLTIAYFLRGIYIYRQVQAPVYKAWVLGLMAAYVGFLLRCTYTMALLHEVGNIASVSLLWALTEVIWQVNKNPEANDEQADASPVANAGVVRGRAAGRAI